MNQTLNDLIKELGTKKQVKVEYLLPKLKKIKREIEPKKPNGKVCKDSFGNPIEIGDVLARSNNSESYCVRHAKHGNEAFLGLFAEMIGDSYYVNGIRWKYSLSVKAYKANPKKYNKLLGLK